MATPGRLRLLAFALVAAASGWLGAGLNRALSGHVGGAAGQLLWLLLPLLAAVALVLTAPAGAPRRRWGLRPMRRGAQWAGAFLLYGATLLIYPVVALALMALALAWGTQGDAPSLATLAQRGASAAVLGFLPLVIKNLVEELTWRGYLAPRLQPAVPLRAWPVWRGHLCVGAVWAAWHLPYYVCFLTPATLAAYTPLALGQFLVVAFAGIVALACVYGELRMLTGSIWPSVLLHTLCNALGNPLAQALVQVAPKVSPWLSPGPESLASIALNLLLAVALYRLRVGAFHDAKSQGILPVHRIALPTRNRQHDELRHSNALHPERRTD